MVLSTFSICDPHVKTVLLRSHCLSLYGGVLWNISCNQLKSLEVALNNILRRIWKLPRNCHTRILHKVAQMDSICNRLMKLSVTATHEECASRSLVCFVTPSPFSITVLLPHLVIPIIQPTNIVRFTLKRTSNVPTLYGTYDSTGATWVTWMLNT